MHDDDQQEFYSLNRVEYLVLKALEDGTEISLQTLRARVEQLASADENPLPPFEPAVHRLKDEKWIALLPGNTCRMNPDIMIMAYRLVAIGCRMAASRTLKEPERFYDAVEELMRQVNLETRKSSPAARKRELNAILRLALAHWKDLRPTVQRPSCYGQYPPRGGKESR